MVGHIVLTILYYEWSELRLEEDKMVYLWSLGRRSAAGEKRTDEAGSSSPAVVTEDLVSEASDMDDLSKVPSAARVKKQWAAEAAATAVRSEV